MEYVASEIMNSIDLDLKDKSSLFDTYSNDLLEYLDFISRNKKNSNIKYIETYYLYRLVERWQPVLGFNESTINHHLIDIQTPKLEHKTSLSIKDILLEDEVQSSWLIPSLLQSCGMYILGGEPKTGKSILCYALCYSVCVSGEFLGLPVKQGNVLFLQLEEPLPTIKKRFKKAGFGNIDSNEETSLVVNFQDNRLRIERNFDITTDINWLIKLIEKYNINLVIIDSLRKATNKSSYSENSNEFGKLVYSLQQVFNITNTCGIVIHHLSKTGVDTKRKYNLIERLAGHTSISAACDGLIGLFDTGTNGQERLTLKTKPRDGFSVSLTYEKLSTTEGLWEFKQIDADSPAKLITTSQVLRCLSQTIDTYVSTKELAHKLNLPIHNPEFLESIQYLVDLEIIHTKYKDRTGYYCLSSKNEWIINPVTIKSLVSEAIIDANNLILCKTKKHIRNLVTDWPVTKKRDAFNVLLPDEQFRLESLIKSWEFEIDDSVIVYPDKQVYRVIDREAEAPSLNNNKYKIKNNAGIEYVVEEYQIALYEQEFEIETVNEEVEIPVALEL